MLKFNCKILILLITNWFVLTANASIKHDAEIIENHEIREYDYYPTVGYYTYSAYVTIKRKIKINTTYGINKFNTLYIPTYQDLDYKMTLVFAKGATIKPNGNVYPINEDHIKETTLPANVPMLYGYEGNVKQLVFSNLSKGDIIEYEYKVRYFYTSSSSYFSIQDELELSDKYPMNKGIYEFILSNRLDGIFHLANSDQHITKNKNNFSVTLLNVTPKSDERYANNWVENPCLLYNIENDLTGVYSSWEKYLKRSFEKAKRKEFFMMGMTVGDIVSEVRLADIHETEEIVKYIKKLIDEKYDEEKNISYLSAISRSGLSIDDAEQILKLIKSLKLNASVLFLKNRHYGNVYKSFTSISQFNSILVKFQDDLGQYHYWQPLEPFGIIDQYSAVYSGTEALELYYEENKLNYRWFKMPIKDFVKNYKNTELQVQLTIEGNKVKGNATSKITENGQFAYYDRIKIELENRSDWFNPFSNQLSSDLEYSFLNCQIHDIEMELNDNGAVDFSYQYDYELYETYSSNEMELNLRDFIPYIRNLNVDRERHTVAFLDFTRNIDYKLTIEIDPSLGSFIPNKFLIRSIENDVCLFTSNVDHKENSLILSLNFGLKKDIISPDEWSDYVDVLNEIESYYLQKLIVRK